jgi:hypothetical protein
MELQQQETPYTNEILDNVGIALFNRANPANLTLANRLDAVGSTTEANTLYKEGPGHTALSNPAMRRYRKQFRVSRWEFRVTS